jgi:hypothetical protein
MYINVKRYLHVHCLRLDIMEPRGAHEGNTYPKKGSQYIGLTNLLRSLLGYVPRLNVWDDVIHTHFFLHSKYCWTPSFTSFVLCNISPTTTTIPISRAHAARSLFFAPPCKVPAVYSAMTPRQTIASIAKLCHCPSQTASPRTRYNGKPQQW